MDQDQQLNTADATQFVCFKLADEEYAVRITDIQEVIRIGHITRIPQVPAFSLGVINLRGNIVSVFDLRSKLKLRKKQFDNNTKIIIANVEGEVFSFIVDQILENITLENSQIDSAPSVGMSIDKDSVAGLGELEGRMITILNLKKVHEDIKKEMLSHADSL